MSVRAAFDKREEINNRLYVASKDLSEVIRSFPVVENRSTSLT